MHTDQFIKRLDKTRQTKEGFDYKLGKVLQLDDFSLIENELKIKIPERIKDFYLVANGLKAINPDFDLIELGTWKVDSGLIHFATFDNLIKIYFKTDQLNQAGEWTIFNKADNYEITLTISSFWSNKIWHWIEQDKRIWAENWWIND